MLYGQLEIGLSLIQTADIQVNGALQIHYMGQLGRGKLGLQEIVCFLESLVGVRYIGQLTE
jgi:hypothetical protein